MRTRARTRDACGARRRRRCGRGIVIAADTVTGPAGALRRVSGRNGGEALGQVSDQTWGWAGGGGGERIKVFAAIDLWDGYLDVSGGPGGQFPATSESAGADHGTDGSVFVGDAIPAIYADLTCG